MSDQQILFADRFLESYAGTRLLKDPKSAIVELVANSWDAGATRVRIVWPKDKKAGVISVSDNGSGMNEEQFFKRWRTLAYDRQADQGAFAEFPPGRSLPKRIAYGRNGIGRFAAFCFGPEYTVRTWRDKREVRYLVRRGTENVPFDLQKIGQVAHAGHGTEVRIQVGEAWGLRPEDIRAEIGMRFLTDPNFEVSVDGEKIEFSHIPEKHTSDITLNIESVGDVSIKVIDTRTTDRTTNQHGIAWHVNGRLVGECSWRDFNDQSFIDGRSVEARRFTFVVFADCLANFVEGDWSGFVQGSEDVQKTKTEVFAAVKSNLLESGSERRDETFSKVRRANREALMDMGHRSRDRWTTFVQDVQRQCPTINESDLTRLAGILANLELSKSKYGLLKRLHEMAPNQLDRLHEILEDWTVDMAKEVLDELEIRLGLLDELKGKIASVNTDEVLELQPLFQRGLWIFGPEYETIEFTSNESMTTVARKLFGVETHGRNRPDFVMLPDSTVGFYAYHAFDEQGAEVGVARLTVVEIKRPGVTISTDQKAQCWRYVKEMYDKGLLQSSTKVVCFVLGSDVDPVESGVRAEMDGTVRIVPLNYSIVIERAKSRLFNLYEKVKKAAPFLNKSGIDDLIEDLTESRSRGEPELDLRGQDQLI